MAKSGFRGGVPGGGMNMNMNMMRRAQQMQQDLIKMQEELENQEYKATAGGGAVTATASGKREIVSVEIDPDAVDPGDVEMLQDLITAAVNEALRTAAGAAAENMSKLTGGQIPGF